MIQEIKYFAHTQALMAIREDSTFEDNDLTPVTVGNTRFAPWGAENNEPKNVLDKVKKADVMASNLTFNVNVSYGLGPRLVKVIRDDQGRELERIPVLSGMEFDFFERNDIPMFMLELLTDMNYFQNGFVELIFDKDYKEIYSIRNKEACFSRWQIDSGNNIIGHGYSSKWGESPAKPDIQLSYVLDEFNTLQDIQECAVLRKPSRSRMIYPVYMPCPGRPYYSRPSWYSLFDSGWYDLNISIPALKKAILENQLGVKFIIYISPKYFTKRAEETGIDLGDTEKMKALRDEEVKKMNEFLAGGDNISKSMTSLTEYLPSGGGGMSQEKYITIEAIDNKLSGGEFISDSESSANVICYAMGIHQSLIGAAPGKNSSSMSGTDKRELYLIKQASMKSMLDRCLRVFSLIKKFNKWDDDIFIEIPEYVFTTLDQNKSGKQESTKSEV